MINKESFRILSSKIKNYWWIFLTLCILESLAIVVLIIEYPSGEKPSIIKNFENQIENQIENSKIKECPEDLSGILTYPFMMPDDIAAITPLGNLNPPGHTSPVDHNYLEASTNNPINLYAPADSIITQVIQIAHRANSNEEFQVDGYLLKFLICDGLELDLTEYQTISEKIQNELKETKDYDCKDGIFKDGHEGEQRQCFFNTSIKVTSGELLGTVQRVNGKFPFEFWAANYNVKPREDVNWNFYNDNRYAHIICLFDLYTGDLKDQYYSKFGFYNIKEGFKARTIEPLCGQVNQNVVGTIQGMWYMGNENEEGLEWQGKGLAFVHDNLNPKTGAISIGGTIREPEIIYFEPTHTGNTNREPSEITADGKIYCYTEREEGYKILVELIDNTHMKVEHMNGSCDTNNVFKNPYTYQR